jgi:hypothetical protein
VKVLVLLLTLVLPAASVAVALTVWLPWAKAVGWLRLQLPLAVAVVVPMLLPSTIIVTVELASAVPEYNGVVMFVKLPLAGVRATGAAGGVVSTVKLLVLELALAAELPTIAVALTVWLP